MKNSFLILSSMFIFMACNQQTAPLFVDSCILPSQIDLSLDEQADIRTCILPQKEESANLVVDAFLRDFTPEQEEKMQDALERMRIVINSKEFKERVLAHRYNGEKTFANNNGLTNAEVYEVIMQGQETLSQEADQEIDLDMTLYFTNNSTVGYTYPNTNRIWVNNKFFAGFTLGRVAANAVHEWTHKLGFGHDSARTTKRPYSVPYAVGTIMQEMVDGM